MPSFLLTHRPNSNSSTPYMALALAASFFDMLSEAWNYGVTTARLTYTS